MSFTIRQMTTGDYDEAMALWGSREGVGLNEADERGEIERYLRANAGMSFVAVADGRVVGAVLGGADGRRGYLHHLAVAASHGRSGLGRALVDRCLQALRAAGMRKCHVHVFASNVEARNFWAATGWQLRDDLVVVSKTME